MLKQCQDNFNTTFSSYPAMIDYHEQLAKASRWTRCKVNELQIEPLDENSPLFGNPSSFALGTTDTAVKDTAQNLGLAMTVNGACYPIRGTAYKSLLDRAKISGTALPTVLPLWVQYRDTYTKL